MDLKAEFLVELVQCAALEITRPNMRQDVTPIMDAIVARLVELGAPGWVAVLHTWLSQYRGLYDWIYGDSDAPESQILVALEQIPAPVDNIALAQLLSHLDFLCWRVRLDDGPTWHPLEQRFSEFVEGVSPQNLSVWQSDRESPEPAMTERWLLEQMEMLA